MFGLVHCNESILAQQDTDPNLFLVRTIVKHWLWPIIAVFGVTGNILAIIVLTKRRMIMSSTNNYLVALALVDIAYLILTLILNTCQHPCFNGTSLANILLVICRPIADFSSNTSVWLTVTFTVERWVAINYPLKSRRWCTVHRARKIIISLVCASLICTLPSVFETKLERVVEIRNSSGVMTTINRIRSSNTKLGDSVLYQRIYFNFVTFAIIWIPLLLLAIFNTILIICVHRAKQAEQNYTKGIKLRRHNRGQQGEQRKITVMLIAVVIVFTVCQIPQAISLTVQSVFPSLSQTSAVLIYNNFANCLVAVNASINFILYCCFSDGFRSTFRSSFAFLSKHYAQYIEPNCRSATFRRKHSQSLENISQNNPCQHRSYSLRESFYKPHDKNRNDSSNQMEPIKTQIWMDIATKFQTNRRNNVDSDRIYVDQQEETRVNSTTANIVKSPRIGIVEKHSKNELSHFKSNLTPMYNLSRSTSQLVSTEKLQQIEDRESINSNKKIITNPVYYSRWSLNDHKQAHSSKKHHFIHNTINKYFHQSKSLLCKNNADAFV